MWHTEEAEELFTAVRKGEPLPELSPTDDADSSEEDPEDDSTPENGDTEEDEKPDVEASAQPGEGRDATSNPCEDGLGFGTGDEVE